MTGKSDDPYLAYISESVERIAEYTFGGKATFVENDLPALKAMVEDSDPGEAGRIGVGLADLEHGQAVGRGASADDGALDRARLADVGARLGPPDRVLTGRTGVAVAAGKGVEVG